MQNSNCELKQNKRKHWIDLLRGFCMVAILLDHLNILYRRQSLSAYNYYVANVLVAFFFLSAIFSSKDTPFFDATENLKPLHDIYYCLILSSQPLLQFLKLQHTDLIFQKLYSLFLQDKHLVYSGSYCSRNCFFHSVMGMQR